MADMDDREDLLYWVWFSCAFTVGSNSPRQILKACSSPREFYEMGRQGRRSLGILSIQELETVEAASLAMARRIIDECRRMKISLVPYNSPLYPRLLREIYAPPMLLYTLGSLKGLNEVPCICMVGTRSATDYSKYVTRWLARGIARAGAVVVSGCAPGLDATAMLGAMEGGGRVIGVTACGLDIDYPKETHGIKREAVQRGGALISELPPGTPTSRGYFPKRNRLMAGLALGVLVTQAPEKSGSLYTVEHALQNNRDVFCVPPYSILDTEFYGVIRYLRDGATPVFSPEDVLGRYASQFPDTLSLDGLGQDYVLERRHARPVRSASKPNPAEPAHSQQEGPGRREPVREAVSPREEPGRSAQAELERQDEEIAASFDERQRLVYTKLDREGKSIPELSELTGISAGEMLSILTELEISGVARQVGGNRYALRRTALLEKG